MTKINNHMMQLIINSMPGIVFWKSLDLLYLGANQRFLNFLGLEHQKQLVGKKDDELDCSAQIKAYLSQRDFLVLQTEQAQYAIEDSFLLNDGSLETLITDKHPIYDDEHNLVGILCLSSIADDKHSAVQTYLENIIASVPYYIFWKNTSSVYLGCNKKFSSFLNKTPEEIIGKTDFEIGWKEGEPELFIEGDKEVMSGNSKVNIEETLLHSDGSETIMLVSKVPVFNKNNQCIGILGVSIDITERKKMEKELVLAKDAAESANHAKTEFIANMSHDIRTPLSGVVGMSKIMENKTNDPEEKQYARWVNESGEQLLELLNGILDMVSADNINDGDIREETFDIRQCIQDIAQLEFPTIQMKNLELQVVISDEVPQYIRSDRTKLHRTLLNLLGNSIKFTKKGHIAIHITLLDHLDNNVRLRFSVIDTGIGIPEDVQSSVFDRFFRVNSSYNGVYKGHGIGLHIAQSYVELLGGEIKLISKIDKGTTFYFDLLVKVGSASEITTSDDKQNMQKNQSHFLSEESNTLLNEPANQDMPYLLLIEDNLIALKTVEFMAADAQCRYKSTDNAEHAFELLQSTPFDLILTDIGLPGMSGVELAKKIRTWEKTNNKVPVPIVGLTAHTGTEEIRNYLKSGMNKVLVKPASLLMILNLVDEFITRKKAPLLPKDGISPDLPATEEELFILNKLPILDVENALNILGNETVLNDMLTVMLNECIDVDKMAIEKAHAIGDWDTVEHLAHRMKGGAAYCGTIRMHKACQYLERYKKAGHSKLLEPLYNQFLNVVEETKDYLSQWLASR